MPENPFKSAVLACVERAAGGLSEYDLIQALEAEDPRFAGLGAGGNLALFRKHFLVMNALYTLQAELIGSGRYLAISPLSIRIETLRAGGEALPSERADTGLRDYYLDLSQLDHTGAPEVDAMLGRFWERYLAIDRRLEALGTLELPADASWESVKRAYRRLAARHHPDRGGDAARFRAVREAYEILAHCYAV